MWITRCSVRLKTIAGGAVLTLVAAVTVLALGDGVPSLTGTDTSERRKYTLVADTSKHRGVIDAYVVSTTGRRLLSIENRRVRTTWKQSVWVESGEVVRISLTVWTYGDHRPRQAPWARCQILRNGAMTGGDTEVDQLPALRAPDELKRQAEARCAISAG